MSEQAPIVILIDTGRRVDPGHKLLTTRTCPTPYSLFHPFFSVSTQISPDLEIFGWKILVIIVPKRCVRITQSQEEAVHKTHTLAEHWDILDQS